MKTPVLFLVLLGLAIARATPIETTIQQDEKELESLLSAVEAVPVLAIDVHPNSTYNGLPVNDTLVIGYTRAFPPGQAEEIEALQQKIDVKKAKSLGKLAKKDNVWYGDCTNAGNAWAYQYQLHNVKNYVCNDFWGTGPYWARDTWRWAYYNPTTNQWLQIHTSDWSSVGVYFYYRAGYNFDWDICFNLYWAIIEQCKGYNPDCAGGERSFGPYETGGDENYVWKGIIKVYYQS